MFRQLCLVALLISLWQSALWAKQSTIQSRIVGGRRTSISSLPYMVHLKYNRRFYCGGSLVSVRFVVTAGHCAYKKKRRSLLVVAGATLLTGGGIRSGVSKIIMPKKFNMRNMNYDVAVLKLKRAFSGPNVRPIPLCSSRWRSGAVMQVSGWGNTRKNSRRPSSQLRTVKVPVITMARCKRLYFREERLTSTMFCAARLGQRDACSGDSGGPAVYNGQLCGIVSWGIGCGSSRYPGVYTNVNGVKMFIKQAMRM